LVGKANNLLKQIDGAFFIDVEQVFCDSSKCSPYPKNTFAFQDEHHLSIRGALLLAETGLDFYMEPTVSGSVSINSPGAARKSSER
jgi:hypothetical protein